MVRSWWKVVVPPNLLVGSWVQFQGKTCDGSWVTDDHLQELIFRADGTFSVTRKPFCSYEDAWGTYAHDQATGNLSLKFTGGNQVPTSDDFDGEGKAVIDLGHRISADSYSRGPGDRHRRHLRPLNTRENAVLHARPFALSRLLRGSRRKNLYHAPSLDWRLAPVHCLAKAAHDAGHGAGTATEYAVAKGCQRSSVASRGIDGNWAALSVAAADRLAGKNRDRRARPSVRRVFRCGCGTCGTACRRRACHCQRHPGTRR